MNRYAAALGLADTHYANPVGLDQRGNYSSARDLATLTPALLRIPAFAKIADSRSAVLRSVQPPRRIETINDCCWTAPWVTGVKTGHTFGAGLRPGRLRPAQGRRADLGRDRRAERRRPLLRQPRTARIRLLASTAARLPIHAGQELPVPRSATPAASCRCSPPAASRRAAPGPAAQRRRSDARRGRGADPPRREAGTRDRPRRRPPRRPGALRAGRAIPAASAFDRVRGFVGDHPSLSDGGVRDTDWRGIVLPPPVPPNRRGSEAGEQK